MSIASRIESMTEHLTNDWDIVDSLGLYTNKLPKEYTQVDYIESSGTQYIDTGVNADTNLRVLLDIAYVSPTDANQNIGAIRLQSENTKRYHLLTQDRDDTRKFLFYFNDSNIAIGDADTNRHLFDFNVPIGKITTDNVEYNISTPIADVALNFYLFGRNSTSTIYMSKIKQWACKMYYNNELVRDFVPCYRNSDNEVGLYDIVNDVFYTNQGTGTFTYGEIQEEHIDRNLENLSLPLNDLYNEVSDKTDLSQNGVVGRTSQESTTGKNLCRIKPVISKGITSTYDAKTGTITYSGTTNQSYPWFSDASIDTIPAGTIVTMSISSPRDYTTYIRIYDSNNERTDITIPAGQTSKTMTTDRDTVRLVVIDSTPANTTISGTLQVQLEQGSTATEFEPYTNGASPNPEFPQPINNLSGNVPYKVSGKNKLPFPYTETTHTSNGVTFTVNNDGTILVNGTATGGTANIKLYGNYREQEQLKLPSGYLCGGVSNNIRLRALNNHGGNYTVLGDDLGNGAKIDTSTYDIGYVELTVKNGTTVNNQLIKPMILDSLEDITYEPYIEPQTFTIPLGDIELCNIDTYEDKIYSSDGRFYLNKETGKVILNGTQILSKTGTGTTNYYRFNVDIGRNIFTTDSVTIIAPIYCNRLIGVSRGNTFSKIEGIAPTTTNYSYKSFNLYIEELSQMTAEEANIWFSNNNTIVYYVLATPTTTEITQENYPSLYNALKQIQDYLTAYKINKEFILGYSSPEIEY